MGVATGVAIAGLVVGGIKMAKGASDKNKAEKELINLETPELKNAFEDIQINTSGSEFMAEKSEQLTANMIEAAKSGGVRGVMSSVPKIMAIQKETDRENKIMLDKQIEKRDYAIAGDNVRLRRFDENRYMNDVAGLGQLMEVGRQDMWNGVSDIVTSAGSAASGMSRGGGAEDINIDNPTGQPY